MECRKLLVQDGQVRPNLAAGPEMKEFGSTTDRNARCTANIAYKHAKFIDFAAVLVLNVN
jgi:hypothetical protein